MKKMPLKWSMIWIVVCCWLVPVALFAAGMLKFLSIRINNQIENTIVTSADKAIEISQLQLSDIIQASKNSSYMPTVKESYYDYLENGQRQKLYNSVTNFLIQQYKYNPNLMYALIYFVDDKDTMYYTYSNSKVNYSSIRDFKEKYLEEVAEITKELGTGIALIQKDGQLLLIRNLMDSTYTPYAVTVLALNEEAVFESLDSIWGGVEYHVFMDGERIVGKEAEWEKDFDVQAAQMKQSRYVHTRQESYVYQIVKEGKYKLCYRIELDTQAILDETAVIGYVSSVVVIFMIPMIGMVFWFFHKKVNKPIRVLVAASNEIAKGHYGQKIEAESNSQEFEYLFHRYDNMSAKLQEQFERIYLEELALKDARIMALQSQINPHFLNNTLEIINWESRLNGNEKVCSMIEALSTMLNATMNRKKENMISLEEELTYVDAYLYIIGERFGERFEVTKEIDEKLLVVNVPRLIIQPIIENAVEHGTNRKETKAKVRIRIYKEEDKLFIEVTNNGHMSEHDRQRIEELLGGKEDTREDRSTSLGIRNVDRRIKIIYGNDCGLFIKSDKEYETISTIVVKLNNYHNNSQ